MMGTRPTRTRDRWSTRLDPRKTGECDQDSGEPINHRSLSPGSIPGLPRKATGARAVRAHERGSDRCSQFRRGGKPVP